MRCLNGEIFARLVVSKPGARGALPRDGHHATSRRSTARRIWRRASSIIFAATGVTDGTLMKGVRFFGDGIRTSSLDHAERSAPDPLHRQHPRVGLGLDRREDPVSRGCTPILDTRAGRATGRTVVTPIPPVPSYVSAASRAVLSCPRVRRPSAAAMAPEAGCASPSSPALTMRQRTTKIMCWLNAGHCLPRRSKRAALVGLVTSSTRGDADHSLDELAGLADAAGARRGHAHAAGAAAGPIPRRSSAAARSTRSPRRAPRRDVDVVIFDNELTPGQLRQLEERSSAR